MNSSENVAGGLFAPRRGARPRRAWDSLEGVSAENSPGRGWNRFVLETARPLTPTNVRELGPYRYPFIVRQSGPRFLLASTANTVVMHLLELAGLSGLVASPNIDIPRLVADLAAEPADYVLGSVFARVEGYGNSLRSMILYGADLADARLFREILPRIQPYRVGLRDVRTRDDVATIGARGDLAFVFRGAPSVREIDLLLNYLSKQRYLSWLSETGEPDANE